jgi:hypothetical protein
MSLTAFEVLQLNLLDQIEAGCRPTKDDTQQMVSLGFALAASDSVALTQAGQVHLANLRSHVRDETDDRMLHWNSVG